jgi:hypothetical protein
MGVPPSTSLFFFGELLIGLANFQQGAIIVEERFRPVRTGKPV